jgi:hypothetical protein
VLCWIATVTALAGWFATVISGTSVIDQQVLHDRGVTATGVITRAWFDQGDGASRTYYCTVRLRNGTTLTVEGEEQTGRSVQVTYDPRGKTGPQLGHRPPAPDPRPLEASRALLVLGFVLAAGVLIGPSRTRRPTRCRPGTWHPPAEAARLCRRHSRHPDPGEARAEKAHCHRQNDQAVTWNRNLLCVPPVSASSTAWYDLSRTVTPDAADADRGAGGQGCWETAEVAPRQQDGRGSLLIEQPAGQRCSRGTRFFPQQ